MRSGKTLGENLGKCLEMQKLYSDQNSGKYSYSERDRISLNELPDFTKENLKKVKLQMDLNPA